jgi:hypothetical protein
MLYSLSPLRGSYPNGLGIQLVYPKLDALQYIDRLLP